MTGRCETCNHWRNPWADDYDLARLTGPGFRDAETRMIDPENAPQWGTCTLIGLAEYGTRVELPAFTKDGSDYCADLHTRADFGCTLHETKG